LNYLGSYNAGSRNIKVEVVIFFCNVSFFGKD